jgi:hypothetical protein
MVSNNSPHPPAGTSPGGRGKRKIESNRALSVDNLLKSKFRDIHFSGRWETLLGEPELAGSWIVWGGSSCGKTAFALQLAKELCRFGRVVYNSLEEGKSKSFKMSVIREKMYDVSKRIVFLDKEPIPELLERLRRNKSPEIVIIDTLQYADMKLPDYISIKREFPRKLFIWISHEKGGEPDGRLAEKVRYDADVKIRVNMYRAFSVTRTGGDGYYTIWNEGATKHWGLKGNKNH